MNARWLATAAVTLAIGVMLGRTAGSAAGDDEQKAEDSLAVRCAQAQLKMAELNLQWAQDMNKKVPGTLIGGMIEQFAEEVDMARLELQITEKTPLGDPYQACVERVKLALRSAETRAKKALESHEKAPQYVSKLDVERVRLSAIIADLQLQRGLALANASPHDKLQWQLEVLGDHLDRVTQYAFLLGQNRLGQFSPGGF